MGIMEKNGNYYRVQGLGKFHEATSEVYNKGEVELCGLHFLVSAALVWVFLLAA